MKMMRLLACTLALGVVLPSVSLAVDRHDRALLAQTKLTMTEAIQIAKNRVNGRALEADLDSGRSGPVYEIVIVESAGNKEAFEVKIDGITGDVLRVTLED